MKKQSNQTVRMATPGQIKDVISAVVESIPVNNLTYEMAQYFIGRKKWLGTEMKKIFSVDNSHADLIADWQAFYCGLGIDCDLSGVIIPDDPGGFGRVIIMAQGITPQSGYDLCAKFFPCWKYTDKNLDEVVVSERTAKDVYAIRVRDRVEADEELRNRSYNDLKRQGIIGITLEEREIFELKFFKETAGKHLDIKNWTFCLGSCYGDGNVPSASWRSGEFEVDWCNPGDVFDDLCSRQAVS
ncbi:MAG: hypothetical protein CO146_02640 [Candidatus Nealsonbacteria bacterium CG_4_9_14_3_um_filter_37_29]|uniref:Uncharacterized protein n=1 Tax=Candidatus Nealsonbacteria bacterium CG_4_9_14_3_um_filter_37_29 TaxID=1974696 RepID=A0A2M7Z2U9_9BACT|nr:MAG: hypothetical protein CO146_02640 [Candidatus Nealsonbacteria bacterium CG_4_9_14_3_um_filter_37_29]